LRWFILNLSGKISAFAPILQLKNEAEFTWGQINNAFMTSKGQSHPERPELRTKQHKGWPQVGASGAPSWGPDIPKLHI
jgi:hypothetical protein